jgi:lipopolysaccharide/colanic/teichoic acid biosynthesis glycosyltransferase
LFDLLFAIVAMLFTLPFYPLIMFAIWLEDGRPFFFAHRRETRGGREFPCIKFRSMRKNAEQDKVAIAQSNKADGPQFYIPNDPRLTRVGAFLRACQLDEIPQFINVLLGHMSVVGPRPSPFEENQYCPPWREARLSVRPGITGLWQVSGRNDTTYSSRVALDQYYVHNWSPWLDLDILARTIHAVIRADGAY